MTTHFFKLVFQVLILTGALLHLNFNSFAFKKTVHFIENKGQIVDQFGHPRLDIHHKFSAGSGMNIFLSENGLHYQWSTTTEQTEMYRVDVSLLGANKNPKITHEGKDHYSETYFLGENQGNMVNSYQRVVYHDIYPHIDWVFYVNELWQLEHDFVVHPGGKVSDIRLAYEGTTALRIDRNGDLLFSSPFGSIYEHAPYTYEQNTGKVIRSSYQLDNGIISFHTASYQTKNTMVIDPVISWASYFGDSEYDELKDIKIGKDGFIYAIGSTNSTGNIATTGAFQTTFGGGISAIGADALITKFDPSGTCIWASYVGGTNIDLGLGLAIDTSGNLYLAGKTNSVGMATIGSYQPVKAGTNASYDAYIAKFDTAGQRLWATYFGGSGAEGAETIAIAGDRYDNIYLAGSTLSANAMATNGAFQSTRPGNSDGFLAKFKTAGTLEWSTYYGTSSNDYINAVATDTSGNIIIGGHTLSTTGLGTSGAHLAIGNGGTDAFVAKFDPNGQRMFATYFGGSLMDQVRVVATDSNNSIYLSGITESATGIATANAHQSTYGGGNIDNFVFKLSDSGNMEWASYYGGSDNETNPAIALSHNKLYLAGGTNSPNNIATIDGIVPTYNNSVSEMYLAEMDFNGNRLWATYLGGDFSDMAKALAIDTQGNVFMVGNTASVTGWATGGAHQPVFGGNYDGALIRINMCQLPVNPGAINGQVIVCENSEQVYDVLPVPNATGYVWLLPQGWIGSSSSNSISLTAGSTSGEIKVFAINTCGSSDTTAIAVTVNAAPLPVITRTGNILTVNQSFPSYQWLRNGLPISGAVSPSHNISVNGDYTLQVIDGNSCKGISNIISVTNSTGIDNVLAKQGIIIYPNPFSNQIRVELPMRGSLILEDITGKKLKSIQLGTGMNHIGLSDLPAGTYLCRIINENGVDLGAERLVKTTVR